MLLVAAVETAAEAAGPAHHSAAPCMTIRSPAVPSQMSFICNLGQFERVGDACFALYHCGVLPGSGQLRVSTVIFVKAVRQGPSHACKLCFRTGCNVLGPV